MAAAASGQLTQNPLQKVWVPLSLHRLRRRGCEFGELGGVGVKGFVGGVGVLRSADLLNLVKSSPPPPNGLDQSLKRGDFGGLYCSGAADLLKSCPPPPPQKQLYPNSPTAPPW